MGVPWEAQGRVATLVIVVDDLETVLVDDGRRPGSHLGMKRFYWVEYCVGVKIFSL